MPDPEFQLELQVGLAVEGDAEEVDRLARQLLREVEESDFASARLSKAAVPEGSKAAGAVTVGSLLVGLLPSALPQLVSYLQSWLKRGEGRTIKIKAASGEISFEVECPVDSLNPGELEKLLAKLTTPFGGRERAQSLPAAK